MQGKRSWSWLLAMAFVPIGATAPATAQSPTPEPPLPPAVGYPEPPELVRSPYYSHAAVVNGGRLVFVSGQVALDAGGQLVGRGDFRKQAEQVFANLGHALRAAGADVTDIVALDTFLVNLADLPAYREVRQQFLAPRRTPPPTSTTVQVAGLVVEGALLEVSAVAVLPAPRASAASPGLKRAP